MRECDIISIHVPLLDATRNIIGEEEINSMKKTAILINTARGGLVDEEALFKALRQKKIAGAGLDCFLGERDVERGTSLNPLLELDNVIATPHYAGHTYDTWLRRIQNGYENIARTANGEEPNYIVNKTVLES